MIDKVQLPSWMQNQILETAQKEKEIKDHQKIQQPSPAKKEKPAHLQALWRNRKVQKPTQQQPDQKQPILSQQRESVTTLKKKQSSQFDRQILHFKEI